MTATLLALLLQATPAVALPAALPAGPPQRFSIVPSCPLPRGNEVVVCGTPDAPRLPLPDERGPPDGPRKPTGDPRAALDAGDPGACALRGCQVGVNVMGMGVAAVRLVGKLLDPDSCCERPSESTSAGLLLHDTVGGVKRAFAKKPDKAGRVTIALDEPLPSVAGRLSP
jgi:hypothetical protein